MSEKRHAISAPALMAAFVALLLAGWTGWAGRAFAASPYDEALAAYSHGGYGKAIKLLGEYVKKTPSAGAYYLLGYSNYKLGRYKEAAEYFSEAYLIDPNFNFSPAGRTCPPAKTGPGGGAAAP
ncbi:MAG: tetratricopeptide repeat protein [Nitrospiraceae bacterium]|nr:tetratricopeptide repeat protein [Nitrospiraceae bacterium]